VRSDSKISTVRWVVFDLGETLVDETSNWDRWADQLGVPRLTFHAVLGATIAARQPHTDVFETFHPGFDVAAAIAARDRVRAWHFTADDLYDDALPALQTLRDKGFRLAVMANQPSSAEPFMATLPVDLVATSAQWGLSKPDPRFFARVAQTVGVGPAEIAYVGDRIDNDVVPAKQAGMLAVHLRRGPWGYLQADWPEAAVADVRVDGLAELVTTLGECSAPR
jgi:HAD superfamily hydrolase (TIGR01509 family)